MGAIGYNSFDSDEAMGWIDQAISMMMLFTIRAKLLRFLQQESTDRDIENSEVEGAVALLLYFCDPPTKTVPRCPINLYYYVQQLDTVSLGIAALKKLLTDSVWIDGWSEPEKKQDALEAMITSLRQLQETRSK